VSKLIFPLKGVDTLKTEDVASLSSNSLLSLRFRQVRNFSYCKESSIVHECSLHPTLRFLIFSDLVRYATTSSR